MNEKEIKIAKNRPRKSIPHHSLTWHRRFRGTLGKEGWLRATSVLFAKRDPCFWQRKALPQFSTAPVLQASSQLGSYQGPFSLSCVWKDTEQWGVESLPMPSEWLNKNEHIRKGFPRTSFFFEGRCFLFIYTRHINPLNLRTRYKKKNHFK